MKYTSLCDALLQAAQVKSLKDPACTQVVKNKITALYAFMRQHKLTACSTIGTELSTLFATYLGEHINSLRLEGKSPNTIRSRKSLLSSVRRFYLQMQQAKIHGSLENAFTETLKKAVENKGLTVAVIAAIAGMSSTTLKNWLAGRFPNVTAKQSIVKLEHVLELEQNELTQYLRDSIRNMKSEVKTRTNDGYGELLKKAQKEKYTYKYAVWPEALKQSWTEFLRYKTAITTKLERSKQGYWRTRDVNDMQSRYVQPYSVINQKAVPSACVAYNTFASWYGYLINVRGLDAAEVDMSSCIRHVEYMHDFIEFKAARMTGAVNNGTIGMLTLFMALANNSTGYIAQQTPAGEVKANWLSSCDAAYCVYKKLKSQLKDKVTATRNPARNIQHIFNPDFEFAGLIKILEKMRQHMHNEAPNSLKQAIIARNRALLAIVIANPLRANMLAMIKIEKNLARTTQDFELRFDKKDFKNARNKRIALNYIAKLANFVKASLDEYLCLRHILLRGKQDQGFLFLSSDSRAEHKVPWGGLNIAFANAMFQYTGVEVNLHAMRHAVATLWLKENPESYRIVADLLADDVGTVFNAYSHTCIQDSFNNYNAFLDKKAK